MIKVNRSDAMREAIQAACHELEFQVSELCLDAKCMDDEIIDSRSETVERCIERLWEALER